MSSDDARAFLESVAGYASDSVGEVPSQDKPVRIGTVDAAYAGSGRPRVLFDGESLMGVRTYPWTSRKPLALDRVVLIPQGHTYVIAGTIDDATVTTLAAHRYVLGEALRGNSTSTILTTSYADVGSMTVTATSHAHLVRISVSLSLENSNSGADRTAQVKILCDGTQVGEFTAIGVPLISGSSVRYSFTGWALHTPTAASHTWTVQALASVASAVTVYGGIITVEEDGI